MPRESPLHFLHVGNTGETAIEHVRACRSDNVPAVASDAGTDR